MFFLGGCVKDGGSPWREVKEVVGLRLLEFTADKRSNAFMSVFQLANRPSVALPLVLIRSVQYLQVL
jgi:hypothetical protein